MDMPKPVAVVEVADAYLIVASLSAPIAEGAKLFGETELREYANTQTAQIRAELDALRVAADSCRCALGHV